MGYVLVVAIMMFSGEPGGFPMKHFKTLEECNTAKVQVPAILARVNPTIEDEDQRAVGYVAECLPFKKAPAGTEI